MLDDLGFVISQLGHLHLLVGVALGVEGLLHKISVYLRVAFLLVSFELLQLLTHQFYSPLNLDRNSSVPAVVLKIPGQSSFRRLGGKDEGVLGVRAPLQEEVPGKATLHVRHTGQDDLRSRNLIYLGHGVAQLEVLELEWICFSVTHLLHQLVAHPLDLRLGKLVDIKGHVVQECEGVGKQTRVLVRPDLVN